MNKSIVVLLSSLTLSGCIAVPVIPDYPGIDIQPTVIYSQPYYYYNDPIVVNRYPGYRNYNYYRHHRPYGHGPRYNNHNRGYGPRYNLKQNSRHNGNTSSRNSPIPHSQSRKLYQ